MIYNPPLPRIDFNQLVLKLNDEQVTAALCPYCMKRPVEPALISRGRSGVICSPCYAGYKDIY